MGCYSTEGGVVACAKKTLRKRDLYLSRLIAFQDTEMTKEMTGVQHCENPA